MYTKDVLTHLKSVIRYWLECFQPLQSIPANLIPVRLGTSLQGRDIVSYQLGTGIKHIVVVVGIHGNEIGTIATAGSLINWLTNQTTLLKQLSVHVVPCLNPDGYAQARLHPDAWHGGMVGRLNGNDVDLNRNFPTQNFQSKAWRNFGKNYAQRSPEFAGATPGSEPETRAIVTLLKQQPVALYIALHNRAGDVSTSNHPKAQALGQLWHHHTGYTIVTETELAKLEQTGTAKIWCEEHAIPYLEIEERSRWQSDWAHCQPAYQAIFSAVSSSTES